MSRSPENPYRAASSEAEIREREIEVRREQYERLFNQQVETLIERGYPGAARMSPEQFRRMFASLKNEARDLAATVDIPEGHTPFVIVPGGELISLSKKLDLLKTGRRVGALGVNIHDIKTAEGIDIPESPAYLIVDVEDGRGMLGVAPTEAIKKFKKQGRSPLTAEEGVAMLTQYPEILDHITNIDLPGSRRGDEFARLGFGLPGPAARLIGGGVRSHPIFGGEPSLNIRGSASCGSRVGV